jgi:hypothetical protein
MNLEQSVIDYINKRPSKEEWQPVPSRQVQHYWEGDMFGDVHVKIYKGLNK